MLFMNSLKVKLLVDKKGKRGKKVLSSAYKWMATAWHFRQIEFQVAKRTSADATLMATQSLCVGWIKGGKKKNSKEARDWIIEHIAHYSPCRAVKYSHSWIWGLRCSQLLVWWVVCACIHMCAHIAALTLVSGISTRRTARCSEKSAVKDFKNFLIWNDSLSMFQGCPG